MIRMMFDLDIIQTVLAVLGGSGVLGGGKHLYNYQRKKTKCKLITKREDINLDDFILLYDEVIEDNTRISPEEILKFIGNHKQSDKIKVCDYLYLCIKERKLIGFLKFIYCYKQNYLFIAYLGIDKKNGIARQEASIALYSKLKKMLKKKFKHCKGIFFEVESSRTKGGVAKMRLFKNAANRNKFECYKIGINYIQPEMPTDKGSINPEKAELLFIPLGANKNRHTTIHKELVLEYLTFIYKKIYGRVYDDKELNFLYQNYLSELLNDYRNNLPTKIPIDS